MRRSAAVSMLAAAPWIGVFNLSVTGGSVDDSWTLHHADAGACDVAQTGSGTESGTLQAGAPVVVSLTGVGTTAFLAPATGLKTVANLDREGTITQGADDGDDGEGCPSGGGDQQPPAPDCGPQGLPLSFTFAAGATPGLSADPVDSPWQNCPIEGSSLPAVPETLSAPPLVTGIGPAPGPGLVPFTLTGTDVQSDADTDATSRLTVQLQLERVAVVEALDVPDGYTTAPVDRSGSTKVPVSCPAGAACRGTISVAAGGSGAQSERAVTQPPRWPKPLVQNEPALGTARFSLKAGRRARISVRLAHGSKQALAALAGQDLDLVVRQAARGAGRPIAFVAGQVKLRLR